jgi:hypothetical protein
LFYNLDELFLPIRGRSDIKTDAIFSVIREVNEILSLTNEPDKLVNTVLDTLAQVTGIECLWIQTTGEGKARILKLAAERGFSEAMKAEIRGMDMGHSFTGEIIGRGGKIIITNLNNDGLYGLDTFRTGGYRWLAAVPLMTYRANGILGAASRKKNLLEDETPELLMVVGGMIASALTKAYLSRNIAIAKKPAAVETPEPVKATHPPVQQNEIIIPEINNEPVFNQAPVTVPEPEIPREDDTPEIDKEPVFNIFPAAAFTPELPNENDPPETYRERVFKTPAVTPPNPENPTGNTGGQFHAHSRRMESFRRAHR